MNQGRHWLITAGCLSLAAALVHLATIAGGPEWYLFFGAGEPIAKAAERGSWIPAGVTLAIATILALWGAYAFSGAGLLRRLPLLRTGLVVITAVYLLRGAMLFFPETFDRPDLSPAFMFWSSSIVLVFGLVYLIGTWRAWPAMSLDKELA